MDVDGLRTEIETERLWREEELAFLRNQAASLSVESQRDRFRRSIVVMLYAHFEGFCKFAFSAYARGVTAEGIRCDSAQWQLVAATLEDAFRDLRTDAKKSEMFKSQLPDDLKIHRFAREVEFLARLAEFEERRVAVDESIIDTESNLKPAVLKKLLFRLGLDVRWIEGWEGDVQHLLRRRNNIAHGVERGGVDQKTIDNLEVAVRRVMDAVTSAITTAAATRLYLRSA